MEVIHERPEDNFTQITNEVLRDERLSHMARGVLAQMLSYADGFTTTADKMWKEAVKHRPWDRNGAGRRAYRGVFQELEAAGYLRRERRHEGDGRFKTVLILRNRPAHWDSIAPVTESEDSPAPEVPEPAHRDRGTGNGRSETGTSFRTLELPTLSSGADTHGLPRRGPRSKQRERDEATILRQMREVLVAHYPGEGVGDLTDWDVWQIWIGMRGDRPDGAVGKLSNYVSALCDDFPYLDGLLGRFVDPEEAAG